MAFFGVKLDGEDTVAPDTGGESLAILGLGCGDCGFFRDGVKAVDEVEVAARGDAFIERAGGVEDRDIVPANLGDFNPGVFAKPADLTFKNA